MALQQLQLLCSFVIIFALLHQYHAFLPSSVSHVSSDRIRNIHYSAHHDSDSSTRSSNDDAAAAASSFPSLVNKVGKEEAYDHIFIEVVRYRSTTVSTAKNNRHLSSRKMAYNSVYKEAKEDVVDKVLDSPLSSILAVLFNPTSLVLALYFSSIAWSKVTWLQRILSVFGRGDLVKKNKKNADGTTVDAVVVEELPFQTYECEVCQMELKPARGRAEVIFGRPRFRCSRCGSKASSYFNIEDMNDPRAVARFERLEKEKLEGDDNRGDIEDDDEGDEDDEEIEKPPSKPKRKW